MTKVAIFGSTGGTGRALVDEALHRGLSVVAAARDPASLRPRERLQVIAVDVETTESVDAALGDADLVVSALGIGRRRHDTRVYSRGAQLVVDAMLRTRARRLVVVSTSSLETPPATRPVSWSVDRWVLQPLLRRPYRDMRLMEDIVRRSPLDWTILRAARLTNGAARGRYRLDHCERLPGGWSISRRDLAGAALDLAADPNANRRELHIAY